MATGQTAQWLQIPLRHRPESATKGTAGILRDGTALPRTFGVGRNRLIKPRVETFWPEARFELLDFGRRTLTRLRHARTHANSI
jgi:hypothetical protein